MIDDGFPELDLPGVLKVADRLDWLCRRAPSCPECGTDQVQIVDHVATPAQWRCRHCWHRFEHEPK